MNHFAWKERKVNRRTEIILYIMAGIVGLAVFMFIHPSFKWQSGPERVPVQASVDRPDQGVSSHPLPEVPLSVSSGAQTKNKPVETAAGNVPGSTEDLDRAFEKFLISQGLLTEPLHREISSPAASDKKVSAPISEAGTELDPVMVESFKNDYPVTDARLQENDEVWIRIDSTDIDKVSMDDMMAAAAELNGNSDTPVKVVVWVGNRPGAVRTFFGDPIF